MKKFIGVLATIGCVWFVGNELFGTASLFQKAETMPSFITVQTLSQAIVLDSVEKTGLSSRYSYTPEKIHTLIQARSIDIPETNTYLYLYCFESNSAQSPKSSMITLALHKTNAHVFGKGSDRFMQLLPDIEALPSQGRNKDTVQEILDIQPETGTCFEI